MSESCTTRLGDLVGIVGGGTPTRTNPDYYGGPIPWVTPKDMKSHYINKSLVTLTQSGLDNSAARLVPANSILIVVRSGVLKHTVPVGVNTVPVAINQDIKALLCSEQIDPRFLARFIKARSTEILQWVRATTADNFPIDKLREITVPVPSIGEQRRIAEILDRADALRVKRLEALDSHDELLQSIFLDFYEEVKEISSSLPLVGTVEATRGSFVNGPFGSDLLTSELQEEGVPVIYIRDIRDGEYRRVSAAHVSTEKARNLAVSSVNPGDVLVAKVGDPPGTAAIYPQGEERAVVTQDVIRLRLDTDLALPEFIAHFLNSSIGRLRINEITVSATRARFSLRDFKKLAIELPPLDFQRKFTCQIKAVERSKSSHRAHLVELDAFFASLQFWAFRGEL